MPRTLNLHFRMLFELSSAQRNWLDDQFEAAKDLLSNADLALVNVSISLIPFGGGDVSVGSCQALDDGTDEKHKVFDLVPPFASSDDWLIFVAKSFSPNNAAGCAWHPAEKPGCIVCVGDSNANRKWKLAHELGHILKLSHIEDSDMLMNPTVFWTHLPPDVSESELVAIRSGSPGPTLVASGSRSLGLEEDIRSELGLIEPNFDSIISKYGSEAIPILEKYARIAEDPDVATRAWFAIALAAPEKDVGAILERGLQQKDFIWRHAVACAFWKINPNSFASLFNSLLKKEDPASRKVILQYFPSDASEELQSALAERVKDEANSGLLSYVFDAIRRIPADQRIPVLRSVLDTKSTEQ